MQNRTSPQFIFQTFRATQNIYLARYLTAIEYMHCSFIKNVCFVLFKKINDLSEILTLGHLNYLDDA